MSVYKPCDIRGPVGALSGDLYRSWGRALGQKLPPGSRFVVGGDVRLSTPGFLEALVTGLSEAGMVVENLGVVPTPLVYFAKRHRGAGGAAIVTASHSPPDLNGLKWLIGELPPTAEHVRQLEREGEGEAGATRSAGTVRRVDVATEYLNWLLERWGCQRGGKLRRVIVDPGNGCWSGRARDDLGRVFPALELVTIHDTEDGTFSERNPDCARPEYLEALSEAVRREGAQLGVAFDGDGDRVAFVDGDGVMSTAEQTTWILLRSFGEELEGRAVVHDIKFSDLIPRTTNELGGHAVAERSGHAYLRTRMIGSGALFGAEISGHYFYGELDGGDDGLFTACRMIAHLARSGTSLTALRKSCPIVYLTPEIRATADDREATLREIRDAYRDYPRTTVDGIRVDFPRGWVLVRRSVTEDRALTLRFEGQTAADLERIVGDFRGKFPGLVPEDGEDGSG